jgi:hypothetical protein
MYPDDEIKSLIREEWLSKAKDKRLKHEKQWLVNTNFRVGNHYLRYNTTTGEVEAYKPNRYEVAVNITKSKHKALKSSLVGDEPVFVTLPYDNSDEEYQAAMVRNRWLYDIWQHESLQQKLNDVVHIALLESYAAVWLGYDMDADDGEGEIDTKVVDAFDLYCDKIPVEDGRWIIKTGFCTKDYLKNARDADGQKLYKRVKEVKTGGEYESDYKRQMRNMTLGAAESHDDKVKIVECYYKTYEDGECKVYIATLAGENGVLVRHEDSGYEKFPCEVLAFDVEPGESSGFGWARDIVALNRVYNHLMSMGYQYHDFAAKFRLLADSNSRIKTFTNQNGQIISKAPGTAVQPLEARNMMQSAFQQMNDLLMRAEDLSVHDVSLGRLPTGVKSGRGIEALKAADAGSNSDYRINVKLFLQNLAEKIMDMAALNYTTSKDFRSKEADGMFADLKVIGENAPGKKMKGATPIKKDTQVVVTIGTALGYTREARQDRAVMLRQMGDLDRQTLLKQFEFDNIAEIEENLARERGIQTAEQQAQQMPPPGMEAAPSQPAEEEVTTAMVQEKMDEYKQMQQQGASPEELQALEAEIQQMMMVLEQAAQA